jgi:hypothetical protein
MTVFLETSWIATVLSLRWDQTIAISQCCKAALTKGSRGPRCATGEQAHSR